MRLVTNYDEIIATAKRFNDDLGRTAIADVARKLVDRLAFIRAWYYVPELDLVAPSKFVGYAGMTADLYIQQATQSLYGRATEPQLQTWFRQLESGSPEEAWVRAKVEGLLAAHHKVLNRAARFFAPIAWKTRGQAAVLRTESPRHRGTGRHTIHATIERGETQFVATCEQLAVVTQGRTVDETIDNLKEAIALHIEGEDLEALGFADTPIVMVTMELLPWAA